MEADILRLILFLVGAAVIFGIYAADRYKRSINNEPARNWGRQPQDEDMDYPDSGHVEPRWDRLYEPDAELDDDQEYSDSQELYQEEDEDTVPNGMDHTISSELEQLEEIIHEDHRYEPEFSSERESEMPKEQMSISFLTREMRKAGSQIDGPDLPTKIIQLNIVPHEGLFYGDDILSVAHEVGLEPGDMDIFHYFGDDPGSQQAVYSMTSMVEPGTFPMDEMDDFSTPGLTLFAQLPGPKDGLTIFADMLYTAEQLANLLEGELRDETHSALTKQTISHMREDIQEYHRQLQLARSRR